MRARAVVSLVSFCSMIASTAFAGDMKPAECVAASEASLQLRDQHRLQEARDQLLRCASASCPAEIREECVRRIERVKTSIPSIVFEAKDQAGNDLSAVKVTMDGLPFAERLDGTALALDPGAHTFRFEVAGQPAAEKALVVREGENARRETVVIGGTVPNAPAPGSARTGAERADGEGSSWSPQKTVSLVVGGAGVIGLAVGGIFGGVAASKWSSAKRQCSSSSCPSYPQAVSDQESASSAAVVSTVGFIGGAGALATAVVLWLTAPSEAKRASAAAWTIIPGIGPRESAFALQRAF